jgi:hypothetical protein
MSDRKLKKRLGERAQPMLKFESFRICQYPGTAPANRVHGDRAPLKRRDAGENLLWL